MIRLPDKAKGVGFMFGKCKIELIEIVDYVTDASSQVDRETLQNHLDPGCDSCADRLAQMQELHAPAEKPEPQRITVSPLLDIQELHFAGVRSVATLARRRVYESESKVCIDIQQQESEDGSVALEGQMLIRGGGLHEVSSAAVALSQVRPRDYGGGSGCCWRFHVHRYITRHIRSDNHHGNARCQYSGHRTLAQISHRRRACGHERLAWACQRNRKN